MSQQPEKLEEARARLAGVAQGLMLKFGALEAARMFQGCVLGLLVGAHGLDKAKAFVAEFAAQVAGEDPGSWPRVGSA